MAVIAIGWVEVPCSQVNKEYSGVVSDGVRKTKHIGTRMRNRTGGDRGGTLRKAPLEGRLGERRTNFGEGTRDRRRVPRNTDAHCVVINFSPVAGQLRAQEVH